MVLNGNDFYYNSCRLCFRKVTYDYSSNKYVCVKCSADLLFPIQQYKMKFLVYDGSQSREISILGMVLDEFFGCSTEKFLRIIEEVDKDIVETSINATFDNQTCIFFYNKNNYTPNNIKASSMQIISSSMKVIYYIRNPLLLVPGYVKSRPAKGICKKKKQSKKLPERFTKISQLLLNDTNFASPKVLELLKSILPNTNLDIVSEGSTNDFLNASHFNSSPTRTVPFRSRLHCFSYNNVKSQVTKENVLTYNDKCLKQNNIDPVDCSKKFSPDDNTSEKYYRKESTKSGKVLTLKDYISYFTSPSTHMSSNYASEKSMLPVNSDDKLNIIHEDTMKTHTIVEDEPDKNENKRQ